MLFVNVIWVIWIIWVIRVIWLLNHIVHVIWVIRAGTEPNRIIPEPNRTRIAYLVRFSVHIITFIQFSVYSGSGRVGSGIIRFGLVLA